MLEGCSAVFRRSAVVPMASRLRAWCGAEAMSNSVIFDMLFGSQALRTSVTGHASAYYAW